MADWALPTTSTVYTDVLTLLKGRDDNAATMFSEALTAATTVPTEAIKWSSSNKRFERWSGSAWLALTTDYAIDVATVGGLGIAALVRLNPGSDQTITTGKLILAINSATPLDLKGGTADFVKLQLFADAAAQSTRSGNFGYASAASQVLIVQNEYANSDLNLITQGTGNVTANGSEVVTLVGGQTIAGTLTATTFIGALTGAATTVTQAAQTAITSVGTLTILTVDNIKINLNTISSIAGTDLLITPLAGQQLILDGTIVIDAGVVTGATSIASTAFVGTLSTAAQPNITSVGTLLSLAVTGEVTGAGFTGTLDGVLGGGTPAAATVTTLEATSQTTSGDLAKMGQSATDGLMLTGQGTVYDVTLRNDVDNVILGIPTGSVDVELPDGNLNIGTVSRGIDFTVNAAAAGMTSQVLDKYEEGTWTPEISFSNASVGVTYNVTSTTGTYTKVGRMVYLEGYFVLTNKGSSTGILEMANFPFTIANLLNGSTDGAGIISAYASFTGLSGSMLNLAGVSGQHRATVYQGAAATVATVGESLVTNTSNARFSFTYQTTE